MLNLPTIKFSELMASVMEDIPVYADANLVDESKIIKVIARCNSQLGVRGHRVKTKLIPIVNGQATLPVDFYKVQSALGVHSHECEYNNFITIEDEYKLIDIPRVKNELVFAHLNVENLWVPVVDCNGTTMYNSCTEQTKDIRRSPVVQKARKISYVHRLHLKNSSSPYVSIYCPNHTSEYQIDFDEGVILANYNEGEILLTYLADLIDDETGELLILNHPKLYGYYEYSAKAKALEDIFMNSEADVQTKMQYCKREANLYAIEAFDFISSAKGKQWKEINKQQQINFYNQWMAIFK